MRKLVEIIDAEFGKGVFVPEKLDNPNHIVFTVADNKCPYFSIHVGDAPDRYSVHVELYGPAHERPPMPMDLVEDCQTDLAGVLNLFRKYRYADGGG